MNYSWRPKIDVEKRFEFQDCIGPFHSHTKRGYIMIASAFDYSMEQGHQHSLFFFFIVDETFVEMSIVGIGSTMKFQLK